MSDKLGLWAVSSAGVANRVSKGVKLDLSATRAVVVASNPSEAVNQANSEAFQVGIRNAVGDEPAELVIYGEIGDPWQATDAGSVGRFLRENKGRDINVRINSPGGLAYDGITIHNALLMHDGTVTTTIEGMAGSAASIIAMAGKPAKIFENAQLFIHRASLIAYGNRDTMAEAIVWLDEIDEAIARTYKAKTGKALDKIMSMMIGKVDGTVFSAKDAVAEKFCNEVIPLKKTVGTNSVESIVRATEATTKMFVESVRAKRIRENSALFTPAE